MAINSKKKNYGSIRDISDYLYCLLLFLVLNIFLFHTGLYRHISIVDSYAGNVHGRLSVLKELEEKHDENVIALIGDSTIKEAVGAKELSEFTGKPVANLALPGTGPTEWLHFLRSIDPQRNRFETLVITIAPHAIRTRPHDDGVQTLLPVASIREMLAYAWRFDGPRKMEYIYAAFDKIFAFRRDLRDLFLSPERILSIRKQKENQLTKLKHWRGQSIDVCEVETDPVTGEITDWGELEDVKIRELAENAINRTIALNRKPVVSGILDPLTEIIKYYIDSTTNILLTTVPFGTGHRIRRRAAPIRSYYSHVEELERHPNVWHWNAVSEPLFKDCRNFYDFRHLNERGRKMFTSRLGMELQKLDSSKAATIDKNHP